MKKLLALGLLLALSLVPALAEETAADSPDVRQAVEMAEKALEQPLDDVPVIGADSPKLGDMRLCGPFLYVAPTAEEKDAVFIPDQPASRYAPAGLPAGAQIRVDSGVATSFEPVDGAREVFPLLYCAGYCGSESYISLGSVQHQAFSALLIDRETGEVAARMNGARPDSTPQFIDRGDYREDMNGNRVFTLKHSPRTRRWHFWKDVFDGVAINGFALVAEDGELVAALGDPSGEIVVPDGVTRIGEEMFKDCAAITGVRFPDTLTYIDDHAFDGCTGLQALTLPDGLETINFGAFAGCTGLKSVELPGGIRYLYNDTFSGCTGLERVTLPDDLTDLGSSCFSGCASLAEIDLPAGLRRIWSGCFYNCSGLKRIRIPDRVEEIPSGCFDGCTALESVGFSRTTQVIGAGAFRDCKSLTAFDVPGLSGDEFTIPSFITSIGAEAFSGCDSLTAIRCNITRSDAAKNWDENWSAGCGAEITWKPASKLPLILGVAAAVAVAAAVLLALRKKKRAAAADKSL